MKHVPDTEVYDTPAEFIGDLIRRDVQQGGVGWRDLSVSERVRWTELGQRVLTALWEMRL